jgi:hypothetical protein
MQLMNFVTSVLLNNGSGKVSRFATSLRLGILNDLLLLPDIRHCSGRECSSLGANLVGTGNCHPKILAGFEPDTLERIFRRSD